MREAKQERSRTCCMRWKIPCGGRRDPRRADARRVRPAHHLPPRHGRCRGEPFRGRRQGLRGGGGAALEQPDAGAGLSCRPARRDPRAGAQRARRHAGHAPALSGVPDEPPGRDAGHLGALRLPLARAPAGLPARRPLPPGARQDARARRRRARRRLDMVADGPARPHLGPPRAHARGAQGPEAAHLGIAHRHRDLARAWAPTPSWCRAPRCILPSARA